MGGLNFVKFGVADGVIFLKDNLNVGIGSINPTEKLTVSDGKLALTTLDATIGGKIYGYNPTTSGLYAGGLKFQTRYWNGSTYSYVDRMTIDDLGNTSLTSDLSTNGAIRLSGKIEPLNTANTLYINQPNSAQKIVIQNAGISRLEVGQTGITLPHLIGTTESLAVVNADGSLSRSTSGSIANGVYNPTMSNVTNTTAMPTVNPFTYMRVGSIVTVYGFVSLTKSEPTQNTNVSFSLPIASNFTDAIDAMGYGVSASTISSGATVAVSANPTLDIVNVNIGSVPSAAYNSNGYNFSFQYRIK